MKHDDLLNIMAADLGMSRYRNESDKSFGIRTVYSASRFWIEAFCLDDGRMGADGCQPGIISRKLNLWLDRISSIYPFIGQWINSQRHYTPFSKLLYNRLIMVGDIISENNGGTYRCSSRHTIQIDNGLKALLGVYDTTGSDTSLPISGMMLSKREQAEPRIKCDPEWWNLPREYYAWSSCSDEGINEYADPSRKSVRDCWIPKPVLPDGIGLGRRQEARKYTYFLLHNHQDTIEARIIDDYRWPSLYTHLRSIVGNPYWADVKKLDDAHYRIEAPFSLLPPETSRWLDFMTWPEKTPDDCVFRIIRTELLKTATDMLESCGIKVRNSKTCQSN